MPSISRHPVEIDIDWHAVGRLLEAGQYEQVVDLLDLSGQTGARTEHPLLLPALAAVRQICLACRQCHADIEWHRQAGVDAARREGQLRQNAQSILNWLGGQELSALPAGPEAPSPRPAELPETKPPPLVVRWLHNLVQSVKSFFIFERAEPVTSIEELTPTERRETPAPLDLGQPLAPTAISPPPPEPPRPSPAYTLMTYFLGAFRVYQQDHQLDEWNGLKGQAILKYLLAHRTTPVAKDVLMDLFWPDIEPEAARRNLHQAVYSLRQTLRRRDPDVQYIHFENNQYFLNPELSVWIDVEEFETQLQTGRRFEAAGQPAEAMREYAAAVSLYQGDFLAEDLYEDWPRSQRERLRTHFLEIASRLSDYQYQQGEYPAAISLCQQILTLDNCFEEAHRRLMHCYLAQGQRHLAIRQFHTCVQALAEELDVPPAEETRVLYESITART
jgi:DNA-binding SARP family transcriptional activator